MFRALGDPERLRLLVRLAEAEACVSELAEHEGEKITTVSARLKTLYAVHLVKRRREARHVFYALADEHVLPLVRSAIDHAAEGRTARSADPGQGKEDTPRPPAPHRTTPTTLTGMVRVAATRPCATAATSTICTMVTSTTRMRIMSTIT
jgi:ArsR family transcriptional regulator, lead/cadmium/zinc/bismuth-responsive transcriptional repressor